MPASDPAQSIDIYCPRCRYNLRGIPDGTCPECGTPFTRKQLIALRRRHPFPHRSLALSVIAWLVVYWLSIGPILVIGFLLLALVFDKHTGHEWPGAVIGGLLGAAVTCWFTWAVALDLGQKLAFNIRLKNPHRPPPSAKHVTLLCFFAVMALLLAAPFGVYGLLIVLLN